jgi:branched-chain amino acid aminotransferase
MHGLLLHNDDILEAGQKATSLGQVGFMNGWGVFSTIHVDDGVLFAFERHWRRMQRDALRMHVPFPADSAWMQARLLRLVEANHANNATLRVAVVRNHGGAYEGPGIDRDFDLIAFTSDLVPWPPTVSLALKPHGRHAQSEFAGTKILSWSFNLTWNEEAHQRGFDEVVLLNERGEVSECTSANIFAVEGEAVWTPPLASGCLPGITREVLLEAIHVPGVTIGEKTLHPADLERADQVFITSTTREVLPVRAIETLTISNRGEVAASLQRAFAAYREGYVRKAKEALATQAV